MSDDKKEIENSIGEMLVNDGVIDDVNQWEAMDSATQSRLEKQFYPSPVEALEGQIKDAEQAVYEIEQSGDFCIFRGHLTREQVEQDKADISVLYDELAEARAAEVPLTVEQRVEILRGREQAHEDSAAPNNSGWHNNGGNDQDGGMEQ